MHFALFIHRSTSLLTLEPDILFRQGFSFLYTGISPIMTQRSSATLQQVSTLAGCSPATVSRVLNSSGPVREDVRRQVLAAIRETGYIHKRSKRKQPDKVTGKPVSAVAGTSGIVEVLLYRVSPMERVTSDTHGLTIDPPQVVEGKNLVSENFRSSGTDFYLNIISGIMGQLADADRRTMLQTTGDLSSPQLLAQINRKANTGVILLGEYSPDLDEFIHKCKVPMVLVDIIHPCPHDVVTIDNLAGITHAVAHLVELGHRDIGYVGAPFNASFAERWNSFRFQMSEHHLPVNHDWVYHGSEHIEPTSQGVAQMLTRSTRPTALVCANDWSAMGVLRGAERCGVRVPDDLSVVGFDDVEAASMVTPALTTLSIPLHQMGRQAARQFLINDQFGTDMTRQRGMSIRFAPELVVRDSTRQL
jgi:DNA-binding LacI/PurR family transcriptional regulator